MTRTVLVVALVAWAGQLPIVVGAEPAREFSRRIELRLAEDAPADGLTAAKIGDDGATIYLSADAIATGRDLTRAGLGKEPQGALRIDLEFDKAAGEKLEKISAANIGKRIAIVSDGKVISAPTVRSAISTEVAISGNFTKAELVDLLAALIEE